MPDAMEIHFPMIGSPALPDGTPGPARPSARYVSADTVYAEALRHGRLEGLYWSAAGQVQRENVAAGLPGLDGRYRPTAAFEIELDGQSLASGWEWAGACERPSSRAGCREAVIALRHTLRPVALQVVTRLDGSPILVRWLEITNTGERPAALARVSPFAGILWNTVTERPGHYTHANPSWDPAQAKYSLGYLASEEWGLEGNLVWQPLPAEHLRIERSALGRTWGSPYFIVRNNVTGELFMLGLAWPFSYYAEFAHRHDALLSLSIGPLAPAPLRVIAPGETVTSPEVHLGPLHASLDGAVAAWHLHLRTSVLPPRPADKAMYTIGARVVEEPGEWILREADIAAEMGCEAFMVDAGWYGEKFADWPAQRGDWVEGSWLPGGLAGIREHIHAKGMLFGLWHEAEAVSRGSALYRQHPAWVLRSPDGRDAAETLNLAVPEAARFFEETVLRLIREHRLDFYKLDYNVSVGEGGQSLVDGYQESEFWRHTEVLQRTYDRVLREFPHVCLENCAGGGGRNDLAMLARFHYACESDWSVMPYAIRALNALTLFIPPEALVYYHNHVNFLGTQAHQFADAETHLRVTLFAVPIYVGFGAQDADRSTSFYERTRRYIALHKGFCRPVLAGHPAVYHHTPDIGLLAPAEWCVLEYALADRSRGYAGIFKLQQAPGEYLLRLRGLDLARVYEVTLDNAQQTFQAPGRELALTGLPVRLDAALTSELVLYRAL